MPFESREFDAHDRSHFKPNENLTTVVFSVNKQKVYSLIKTDKALNCDKEYGPSFGWYSLEVTGDYRSEYNFDWLYENNSSFHCPTAVEGELFGTENFMIDEYEVYKLE